MTFLFDIGKVLLDFDFESSLARLLPPGCADSSERIARLTGQREELEAGRMSVDDFTNLGLGVLGSSATHDEFLHAWRHIFTPNEPMWRRVRQLAAAGHQLILFSNIGAIHMPWIYAEFPEFALFHHAVTSFQTGFLKPDPEIYQYAVRHHGLVPAETFFIDDLPQNAATGRALGFRTWQYNLNDHPAFETWLAGFPI